jgi:hypothetical protein
MTANIGTPAAASEVELGEPLGAAEFGAVAVEDDVAVGVAVPVGVDVVGLAVGVGVPGVDPAGLGAGGVAVTAGGEGGAGLGVRAVGEGATGGMQTPAGGVALVAVAVTGTVTVGTGVAVLMRPAPWTSGSGRCPARSR